MTSRESKEPIEQRHSFSDSFARTHSVKEAIVLKFLAHKVRKSKKIRDGKKWHYDTIEALAERFPYIPRSTLDDVLKGMAAKRLIEFGNYNKWTGDRTRWYTVPEMYLDAVEEDLRYFDVATARSRGIAEAVILANLDYWGRAKANIFDVNRYNRSKFPDELFIDPDVWQPMIPSVLQEMIPFSKSTIRRALKSLLKKGLIVQKEPGSSHYMTEEWLSKLQANRKKPEDQ